MELRKRKSIDEYICRDWGSCIRETRVGPLLWCVQQFCTVERIRNSSNTSQRVWTGLDLEDYGTLSCFPFYLFNWRPQFVWIHLYTADASVQCNAAFLSLFSQPHILSATYERRNDWSYLQTAIVWIVSITLLHYTNVQMHLSRVNLNSTLFQRWNESTF